MIYERDVLDRATGEIATVSLGDFITVTELGERYGVGKRRVREILHHMGLLAPENGRYRLPRSAVEKGLGIRHDRPRVRHPFDVLSPRAQAMVAQVWDETVADLDASRAADPDVLKASLALEAFKANRPVSPKTQTKMTTQMEVCWLLDHFGPAGLTLQQIANILGVDRALVSRHAGRRSGGRALWRLWKKLAPNQRLPIPAEYGFPHLDDAATP